MTECHNGFRHVTVERGTEQERSLLVMHPGPESIAACTVPPHMLHSLGKYSEPKSSQVKTLKH